MTIKDFMRGHVGELVWIVAGYDAPNGVKRGDVLYNGVSGKTRVVGYEYNDFCHWWTVFVDNSITEPEYNFIQSFGELGLALKSASQVQKRFLETADSGERVSLNAHVSREMLEKIRKQLEEEIVIISMIMGES